MRPSVSSLRSWASQPYLAQLARPDNPRPVVQALTAAGRPVQWKASRSPAA